MGIEDLAGNELLSSTTGEMLGFEEVPPEEVLPLRVYEFLTQVIRDEDAAKGNLFVQRYLDGPQKVWEDTQATIFRIKDLFSITDILDEHLSLLKNLLGWTGEPVTKRVTDRLDFDALRRLIAASVPFWKERGPETAIIDFLSLLTGKRLRIWDWFDLRWIIDETDLSETHQGRDPFLLELPQDGSDEHRFNVRIVDPGDLDRVLVVNVVKLMRPVGERIDISYITFLDQFLIDGDNTQWEALIGALPTVEDGLAKLTTPGPNLVATDVEGSDTWSEYVAFWRIRLSSAGAGLVFAVNFYVIDSLNFYQLIVSVSGNTIKLFKVVAGVQTSIVSFDFSLQGTLVLDKFYGIRIQIAKEGATNRIKVYVDTELIIDTTDSAHAQGSVGFENFADDEVEVDEVEMFLTPLESDEVGINT